MKGTNHPTDTAYDIALYAVSPYCVVRKATINSQKEIMIITTFKSIGKAYVDLQVDLPWPEQAELLMAHHRASRKENVPMFNLAEFKSADDPFVERARRYHGQVVDGAFMRDANGAYDEIPNTVRRCKGNIVSITGIVLDVDEAMTIESAMDMLASLEYVLYTTFRHTADKHKFRIVIPFSQPLMAADIAGRQQSIMSTFPGVDNASFTVSQSFYFHSGNTDPIAHHNTGVMLDPYRDFAYNPPKLYTPPSLANPVATAMTDAQAAAYKAAVLRSLNGCSGLHYAGRGGSNHAVLTLISLCRSVGLTFEEFDAVCARIAHPDSQLVHAAVRVAAWTGWAGDRIRRQTRDEFIREYGGSPIQLTDTAQSTNTRYEEYVRELEELEQLEQMIKNRRKTA